MARTLILADSTAHGFGDVGIFGEELQVFVVCCGGSLILGRKGHDHSSLLQQVVTRWPYIRDLLGGPQTELPLKVVVVPAHDSVNSPAWDRLGELRQHFDISESNRTINSYYPTFDGCPLYGSSGGKKLHFIGGKQRACALMRQIAADCVTQTNWAGLHVVVCAGWNALPSKTNCFLDTLCCMELQCLKAITQCHSLGEFLQVATAFSGLPINSYLDTWIVCDQPAPEPLMWLPRRRLHTCFGEGALCKQTFFEYSDCTHDGCRRLQSIGLNWSKL